MSRSELLDKQKRFVREFLIDRNATQAAIRAGYSAHSAAVCGSKMLKVPKIRAAIESAEAERSKRTEITADRVLQELWRIATSDIAKAFDEKGSLLPVHLMPPEARAALAGVETEELFEGQGEERVQTGLSRKVKHWDKVKALELAGKHLGMWRDKVEVSGENGKALAIHIDLGAGK